MRFYKATEAHSKNFAGNVGSAAPTTRTRSAQLHIVGSTQTTRLEMQPQAGNALFRAIPGVSIYVVESSTGAQSIRVLPVPGVYTVSM